MILGKVHKICQGARTSLYKYSGFKSLENDSKGRTLVKPSGGGNSTKVCNFLVRLRFLFSCECAWPPLQHIFHIHQTFMCTLTFENISDKVFLFPNWGPILHQDIISFHLSHPPLLGMCHFYVLQMSLLGRKVSLLGGKVSLLLHKN